MAEYIAWIGVIASVASTAYSVYSSERAESQAEKVEKRNKRQLYAQQQAAEKEARDNLKKLLGQQRALYGKAGVDLYSGSPLLVIAATAEEAEEDIGNIRRGYSFEAYKEGVYGKQARAASRYQATSSFFTGLGRTADIYSKMPSTNTGVINKNPYTGVSY